MPPKADGGDGGLEPDEEEREMMERELLISNLKNKIGKYNQKGTELQEENARLNNELEMQKLNLQHINDYLTRELEAKEN